MATKMKKSRPKKWMQDAVKKSGALRKSMGVKKGKTIPMGSITEKISSLQKKAKGPKKLNVNERLMLRRLVLAKTFKKTARRKGR